MRRRVRALAGTFAFLLIAPGTVAGMVPWLISHWRLKAGHSGALTAGGITFIVFGLIPLLESFSRFAWKGLGTPAPVAPTKHLVVSGFYRYVRNPMYLGVIAIITGQALLFADVDLVTYALAAWLVMHAFVSFYEEPKLRRTFGPEYAVFCAHVPRWLPRLRPWTPSSPSSSRAGSRSGSKNER
jgi:protein-S-isoprenylcysteine O-methyltransferase Ste14